MSITKRFTKAGQVRYDVRHRDPRNGSHRSVTCRTHKEAKAAEAEFERQTGLGAFAQGVVSRQLVSEYLAEWFDREKHGWARSTRIQRADVIDKWVDPYIPATARLCDFAEQAVARWLGDIRAAGAPGTQANAALSVLSSAMGAAVRDRLITRNPCQGIPRVRVAVSRPLILTPLQVERVRDAMPTPRDALLVSILFYAGLRVGEALALRWESVMLEEVDPFLVVERNFVKGELKGTKTGRIRRVELCGPLRDDLAELRADDPAPGAFVAPSRQGGGGPLDRHNWHARIWKPAAERAGVVATPGDGRHTFASLLNNAGEPLIHIANQLGHSMTRTTELYSHAFGQSRVGRGEPMEAAILAARRELAGDRVRSVYDLAEFRAARVAR